MTSVIIVGERREGKGEVSLVRGHREENRDQLVQGSRFSKLLCLFAVFVWA